MLWSKANRPSIAAPCKGIARRRFLTRSLGLIGGLTGASAGLVLTNGCGFQPLYGTGSSDGVATEDILARINVRRIAEREGQVFRINLLAALDPNGLRRDPEYDLKVSLVLSEVELGITNEDAAQQANLRANARFNLTQSVTGATELTGSVQRFTSYAILSDEFATRTAADTAQLRLLEALADDVKTRLALHFARTEAIE